MVPKILPFCGSARTAEHNKVRRDRSALLLFYAQQPKPLFNALYHHTTLDQVLSSCVLITAGFVVHQVFLEGVKAALTADVKFQGGWYSATDLPVTGLRAAARVYAGWGFSQPWYRDEVMTHTRFPHYTEHGTHRPMQGHVMPYGDQFIA